MKEIAVEDHLVRKAKDLGGVAWKLPAQWYRHIPDRMVLLPGARLAFVELKRPGQKPRLGQQRMGEWLQSLGFVWATIDTKEGVDAFLSQLTGAESDEY